jgi:hypothetical protein
METLFTKTPSQTFNELVLKDENLNSINLPLTRSFIFKPEIPFDNFLSDLSILTSEHPMFVWNYEDGLRSLVRRGFYKIVSDIEEKAETDFITGGPYLGYWAYVIYAQNKDSDKYYLFYANIGPLYNKQSVIFNLSPTRESKIIKFPDRPNQLHTNRLAFFNYLKQKTFYVSLQQRLGNSKQTFSFLLE